MPSNADKSTFLNHNYNRLLLYGADTPVKPEYDIVASPKMTKNNCHYRAKMKCHYRA